MFQLLFESSTVRSSVKDNSNIYFREGNEQSKMFFLDHKTILFFFLKIYIIWEEFISILT